MFVSNISGAKYLFYHIPTDNAQIYSDQVMFFRYMQSEPKFEDLRPFDQKWNITFLHILRL